VTAPQLIRGAVVYDAGFAVDADGAPRAYAEPPLEGLDRLANAGSHGNWYGLACNSMGVPFVQQPGDPAPGYYVSTTALVDRSKAAADPARYVDSELYPYASVASDLTQGAARIRVGDVAFVIRDSRTAGAVVADVGPRGKYGEGSVALARALGVDPDPRRGGVDSGVRWVVFPGSSRGWPRLVDDYQAQARALYDAWSAVT
jgi:hypothetical protein